MDNNKEIANVLLRYCEAVRKLRVEALVIARAVLSRLTADLRKNGFQVTKRIYVKDCEVWLEVPHFGRYKIAETSRSFEVRPMTEFINEMLNSFVQGHPWSTGQRDRLETLLASYSYLRDEVTELAFRVANELTSQNICPAGCHYFQNGSDKKLCHNNGLNDASFGQRHDFRFKNAYNDSRFAVDFLQEYLSWSIATQQ